MMGFKIRLVASEQLKRNLKILNIGMEEPLEEVASAGAIIIEGAAKHKVQRKRGTLSDSIHHETVEKKPYRCIVKVGTDLPYAAQREFGGFIYPRNKQVLHWVTDSGEDVFAAWVYQGPHPYMRPAIDENHDRVIEAMRLAWNSILRSVLR